MYCKDYKAGAERFRGIQEYNDVCEITRLFRD